MNRITQLLAAIGTGAAAIAGLATTPACAQGNPAQSVRTIAQYRVRPGDTLYDLARRYMLHQSDYAVVQAMNHVATPAYLAPNTVLQVPVALLRTEPVNAQLVWFRGAVRIGTDGHAPHPGDMLAEGTRLETGEGSFLTLRAVDGSVIAMPSLSVMRLARMRRVLLTGALDQDYTVERGRIQTEVTPQSNPGSHYQIRTPIAVSAVRGTIFRVAYGDGPSLTEVLGGVVAVGAPGSYMAQPIPTGMGAALSPTGAIATEALLPPPALARGIVRQGGDLWRLGFDPVQGAVAYHAELSRDAQFHEIIAENTDPAPEAAFRGVALGHYFLRVEAISARGFEGLPARLPLDRNPAAMRGELSQAEAGTLRFAWRYDDDPATVYRFQLMPVDGQSGLHLDRTRQGITALTVDNCPPGRYQWRVGAVVAGNFATTGGNGDDEAIAWTPFSVIEVAR